ncbi:1-acyl-sn-glycerol-3-phosphate acyltransferase alpha-like isoform X1 [Ahaetulla prasina]|uniref:1-acyl-sn-glycerol-3-phosphate acyltransferase alpha-like isoform X1 n=1 Tax=Ahaetulla prasina TaxID=499056 RepID=UPI0026486917|nr:1-acyl-sn-glycerol-3-phosphate acyltransferase alpha-like isoform X1 [Ahaetulla prasina]
MDLLLLTFILLVIFLLYQWSMTFRFFCKLAFISCWILFLSVTVSPWVAVFIGQRVENMKLLCSLIRPLKYIYNITFTVQGSENLNIKQSYVIVCNHQTNFDLLAMVEILPERCVPITKKELLYWGPVGFSGWLCNLVFIDRKKQHQARDTLGHLAERMQHEKLRIWVYPEGTRNREDTMLPFKRGAFHLAIKAQVPIVPIVISSYNGFYSFKDKRFDPGNITIRILPKIQTQGLDLQDISGVVESTRRLMQDTFNDISGKIVQRKMRDNECS